MKREKDDIAALKQEDKKRALKLKEKQKKNRKWMIQIFFMAFLISVMFSFVSETMIPKLSTINYLWCSINPCIYLIRNYL